MNKIIMKKHLRYEWGFVNNEKSKYNEKNT